MAELLDRFESLVQIYMEDPSVGGDPAIARRLALKELESGLGGGVQGVDALQDFDADKSRALIKQARGR